MDCSKRGQFHWKQDTPAEQGVVILQSIEGHVLNLEHGVTTAEQCIERLRGPIDDLRELLQAALPKSWDGVTRK